MRDLHGKKIGQDKRLEHMLVRVYHVLYTLVTIFRA